MVVQGACYLVSYETRSSGEGFFDTRWLESTKTVVGWMACQANISRLDSRYNASLLA